MTTNEEQPGAEPVARQRAVEATARLKYESRISRAAFLPSSSIQLPETVLADDLEKALDKYHLSTFDHSPPLLVDFASARYVDVAALLNLTATVMFRLRQGHVTYIGIPTQKRVRDFFRVWRYPDNFFEATRVPFEKAMPLEDLRYRGEAQTTYEGLGGDIDMLEYDRDWREDYPTRRNFFECCTYRLKDEQGVVIPELATGIPRREGNRWNDPLIKAVLSTHLATGQETDTLPAGMWPVSHPDDIARVAVYESLSNAVRHPEATVIQAVSKFDHESTTPESSPSETSAPGTESATKTPAMDVPEPIKKGSSYLTGHLRIGVWDDGKSIVETLQPLIRQGKPVRSLRLPDFMYDRIAVVVRDARGNKVDEFTVNMAVDPTPDDSDERILLSSLFPGVSRAVAQAVDGVEPFDSAATERPMKDAHGLGLYALIRTVLDSYQGVVFLRTGRFRLLLELAHDGMRVTQRVRYKAKLTRYPDTTPPFNGNLIVIHFPVRKYRPVTEPRPTASK